MTDEEREQGEERPKRRRGQHRPDAGETPAPGRRGGRGGRSGRAGKVSRPVPASEGPAAAPEPGDGTEPEARVHAGALPRTTPQGKGSEAPPVRGYRSTRRSSKSGKRFRAADRAERVRSEVGEKVGRAASTAGGWLRTAGTVALIAVVLVGGIYGLALGINAFARWNAKRLAEQGSSIEERAKDNLLVIGVRNGQAVGFTALKAERPGKRVLGIAIPDGAFVEVPGQGFERIGDSYVAGPQVSEDAVSNYLFVPFKRYVVVDGDAYQALLKSQDVAGLLERSTKTNLSKGELADLTRFFAGVAAKDVWIVPLPVRPIVVGDQRYFEPQRKEVADLLLQWWGVRVDQQKTAPRVIVYNGVGTPGIAGLAAQQLIRKGFRIVDSGNADDFDYKTTKVLLYHGTQADAKAVRDALGVGEILVQSAPQQLTDMIVIIGSDYVPPAGSDAP